MKTITPILPQFPSDWPRPQLSIKLDLLPPLPDIEEEAVAAQARAQAVDFLSGIETNALACYTAELKSNRRLEWIGDAQFDVLVRMVLARIFPKLLTAGLTQLRGKLVSNTTLCYLSRCYQLDSALGKGASKHYKIVANLFEAHVGAICSSGSRGWKLMEDWTEAFLSPEVIPELWEAADNLYSQAIALKGNDGTRKRALVQGFDGSSKRSKNDSTAKSCSCGRFPIEQRVPTTPHSWIDIEVIGEGWHSCLAVGGSLKACGSGKRLLESREAGINAFFKSTLA